MKNAFALLAVLLATAAHAQDASIPQFVLSANNALFTRTADNVELHPCQPLKGDRVKVLAIDKRPSGHEVATVRVESGQCQGREGLASVSKLEAADAQQRFDPTARSASTPLR